MKLCGFKQLFILNMLNVIARLRASAIPDILNKYQHIQTEPESILPNQPESNVQNTPNSILKLNKMFILSDSILNKLPAKFYHRNYLGRYGERISMNQIKDVINNVEYQKKYRSILKNKVLQRINESKSTDIIKKISTKLRTKREISNTTKINELLKGLLNGDCKRYLPLCFTYNPSLQ